MRTTNPDEEVFEDLAFDALHDYLNETLVSEDGHPYMMTSLTRHSYYEVDYELSGMPIPWRSDIGELLRLTGNDYGRAQSRKHMKKENNDRA